MLAIFNRSPLRVHACLVALAVVLVGSAARADNVSYKSGDDTVTGYLALPKGAAKAAVHPGLIVIHEWWGLNDFPKDKARAFAEKGYVTLAVDLYRGKVAGDADTAHQLMRGLPEDRAAKDLLAAYAYLAGRKDVDPARIGVIGWCMGGGYSLMLATLQPRLAAAVIYYGRLVTDKTRIAQIKAPLLLNFGADDKGIPKADVEQFTQAAQAAGVRADAKIYPGAGHGFASSKDPAVFNQAAAKDADARTDAFLSAHVREQASRPAAQPL